MESEKLLEKMNVLFICKYNRFRSRVAEAYFKKINKNKKIKARSAGVIKGNPVNRETAKLMKEEFGLNIMGKTNGLSDKILEWQDMVVIMADDVPPSIFNKNKKYGKKVVVLSVKDVLESSKEQKIKAAKQIIKKINWLVKKLKIY